MEKELRKSYWVSEQKGSYSNNNIDTFNPENNYIGMRLQQGVPLLDRDWNELEDIRRYQEMILGKWFIGDGTPDNGFNITCDNASPPNIKISKGGYLVDGFVACNKGDLAFPQLGVHDNGQYDLVYLDLWIEEILWPDNNQDVKTPTCARQKINCKAKVAENKDMERDLKYLTLDWKKYIMDLPENENQQYHHYAPLALLDRNYSDKIIVTDLRRGVGNFAPTTHSIEHEIVKPLVIKGADNSEIEIKMLDNLQISEMPNCPYRYILWASAGSENEISGVDPSKPLISNLQFSRSFYNPITGQLGDEQNDSNIIKIKTEYSFCSVNQYVSDWRPFRRGTYTIKIMNKGEKDINIYRLGLIYYLYNFEYQPEKQ